MNLIEIFEREQGTIRKLDFDGHGVTSEIMYRQYLLRNSFGLSQTKTIHRIIRKDFFDRDRAEGLITFPKAAASVWKDPLENPLADVEGYDKVTGLPIQLGALVKSFYGLCCVENRRKLTLRFYLGLIHY